MAKRSKGIAYLLLGCVLLLVAGGWYAYNTVEDTRAGQQAAEILSKWDAEQKKDTDVGGNTPVLTVDGDAFCGKVAIETLGVALPVYHDWNYTRLKTAPCRYSGSPETNDLVIAAHNYKSHFGFLNRLKHGDEIAFTDASGRLHRYEVCEIITLDGTAVSDMRSGGWDLTLFTCTKSGEQRITVRCERKTDET